MNHEDPEKEAALSALNLATNFIDEVIALAGCGDMSIEAENVMKQIHDIMNKNQVKEK